MVILISAHRPCEGAVNQMPIWIGRKKVTLKKCNAKNSRTLRMLGELFNKKDTIPKGFAGA
jgi:hypothetical protein